MLVQVSREFAQAVFQRTAYANKINHRQVLDVFTQTDTSRMRTDRNPEFGGQQQDCQHFVHAAQSTTINLTDADRTD